MLRNHQENQVKKHIKNKFLIFIKIGVLHLCTFTPLNI